MLGVFIFVTVVMAMFTAWFILVIGLMDADTLDHEINSEDN